MNQPGTYGTKGVAAPVWTTVTPADFATLTDLKNRLLQFQTYCEAAAKPFRWRFTRRDPAKLLSKLNAHGDSLPKAA